MSSDKRTVATDALATLGTIITDGEKRDAIHIAVEPIVAAHDLMPGDHVGLTPEGMATPWDVKWVGIVDPFLKTHVKAGERFWLLLYPGQVTSLRHVWTHPDFAEMAEDSSAVVAELKAKVAELESRLDDDGSGCDSMGCYT